MAFVVICSLSVLAWSRAVTKITYHVALSFVPGVDEDYLCGRALEAVSGGEAIELAEWLAKQDGGAVAFTRRGNPDAGEYRDAKILRSFGNIPADIQEQIRRQSC